MKCFVYKITIGVLAIGILVFWTYSLAKVDRTKLALSDSVSVVVKRYTDALRGEYISRSDPGNVLPMPKKFSNWLEFLNRKQSTLEE